MRSTGAWRGARAAGAGLGALCAVAGGCKKDPVVTTRTVTLHAPVNCASGLSNLDGNSYGTYQELGDFDGPAPASGHLLGDVGVTLPEVDTAAKALLVDATESDREWQGVSSVAPQGAIDVLLLPALTSCSLAGVVASRAAAALPALAPIGSEQVLLVGGNGANGAAAPSVLVRLDTGAVGGVTPDLATPRNGATVTSFGTGALVATGTDARTGTVLEQAEVYDAAVGGYDPQTIPLGAARTSAGAVVLATGETLVVGGAGADGKTALASMEIVDPVTRTSRTTNVAQLAVARIAPSVLRLASGEIFVAGGTDSNGVPVSTLEWFAPDASASSQRTQDLVTGSARAYAPLEGGGALAVVAPPPNADASFQNTWVIDADGVLEAATPIPGTLTAPVLFGGAGGAPVLWTGDRWLRWQPWQGAFGALGTLDDVPPVISPVSASPDPGLALWLDESATPQFTALRFDVRGDYSPLSEPALLVSDTNDVSPDRLAANGDLAFDPTSGLTLAPGASAFVTDRTYADVRIQVDAPTGQPALLVLRDPAGNELAVGGASCPGAIVTGSSSTLTVTRQGARITWSVTNSGASSSAASNACASGFTADTRLSIGVRGAPDLTQSVAQNLRVTRLGSP